LTGRSRRPDVEHFPEEFLTTMETGHRTGEETWSHVYRWRILATIHTGITRIAYFLIWVVPNGIVTFKIESDDRGLIIAAVAVHTVVGGVVARRHGKRCFAPVARWLDDHREPTPVEQECLLAQPRLQAAGTFAFWVAGGARAR
jgi:hypothetical protein